MTNVLDAIAGLIFIGAFFAVVIGAVVAILQGLAEQGKKQRR